MKGGVRKRGNTWYYYFDMGIVDGKRKKVERSASAEGARTKAEAEIILRRKILEYENSGLLFKPEEITLHDFLKFWLEEYVALKLRENTYQNYVGSINKHILPKLGNYKIKSLNPQILQNFLNDKTREGYSRQTLSIIKGILSKSLNQAVYPYKYIKENPMLYVEVMKETERKPTKETLKIQSIENLRKINAALNENHPFYLPFHIGLHCGLRVGEVCGLEWHHIDLENMAITIEQQLTISSVEGKNIWVVSPPKSKASYRTISIGTTLTAILKKAKIKQKQDRIKHGPSYSTDVNHDFVCKKENGANCTPSVIKYHTRETISKKIGIPFNYHSLRHTHATTLVENGTPIKTIQKRLGHSRSAITEDYYVHLTKQMSRDAANIFDTFAQDL